MTPASVAPRRRPPTGRPTVTPSFDPAEGDRDEGTQVLALVEGQAGRPGGAPAGTEDVSPAMADDLSGLPTPYIDTKFAETFRNEDTRWATRIRPQAARPNSTSG
ncbi:hypothetical protein GCM10027073_29010 [Streptomyces chlorus]